ncbi:MAG: amidase [Pseudomonadota bacterium]
MPTLDPYGAFLSRNPEAAGPTVAVKDMVGVAGHPQEAGIPARKGRTAPVDADVITCLKRGGYEIAGVTVTDAAGFGTMTPSVENPRNPAHAAGGSSGGTAAAVAAGLATIGLGTDTGGSVRIPAAYCGLYAFLASRDTVSHAGILPMARTFDRIGLMARTLPDLLTAAAVLIGPVPSPPSAVRLRLWQDGLQVATPAVAQAFNSAIANTLTATIGPYPTWQPPAHYNDYALVHSAIVCAEAFETHAEDFSAAPSHFPADAQVGLRAGAQLQQASGLTPYRRALPACADAITNSLNPGDVIVSPTLPIPPQPRYARSVVLDGSLVPVVNANIRLTVLANVAGLPAVIVPAEGGSVQFMGPPGSDGDLLGFVADWAAACARA